MSEDTRQSSLPRAVLDAPLPHRAVAFAALAASLSVGLVALPQRGNLTSSRQTGLLLACAAVAAAGSAVRAAYVSGEGNEVGSGREGITASEPRRLLARLEAEGRYIYIDL